MTIMKKYILLGVLCLPFGLGAQESPALPAAGESAYEQTASAPEEASSEVTPGAVSKSALVRHVDLQLGERIIHSNELDYTLPAELRPVADKCRTSGPETCYVLYKGFENAASAPVAAQAHVELAVLSMQRGQVKQALAYIDRAVQLQPEEPFFVLQRGWIALSAGKYKKARQAFADMLYLTADFEYASSAKLGTALAYYLEGHPQAAAKDFQYIYTSNPYLISFAAYMMGQIASEQKDARKLAPVFLQQALGHDTRNYPALQLLAQLSEQDKTRPLASFQYYSALYGVDPDQEEVYKKLERYGEKLNKKPEDYLFYLHLDQPIVQEVPADTSEPVRMALYADRWQQPVALKQVSVMASGVMTVNDERLGEVLKTPSYVTRVLVFNPQTKSIDIQDARGHVEFSARRPFVLRPGDARKTLLVKDALAEDIFATDFSDKELAGVLHVIPSDEGILLVNETTVERLIPALLATQAQQVHQEAALQALAVVFRAALTEAARRPTEQPYQLTDNDVYFKFKGINMTVPAMTAAAQHSRTLQLSGTELGYYAACGPVSYDSIANTAQRPDYQYSPANVAKYMLSNPPADLYSAPADPTQWSAIKWVYLYDAKDIAARLNARTDFGKLRALMPEKIAPNGRVLSMRFEGSKGEYITENEQETLYILSAGTQRSGFFDYVPLYKGSTLSRVLVRGYDTGTGIGLCVAGAEGLAREGKDYQAVIKYYFPQARILNTRTGELH